MAGLTGAGGNAPGVGWMLTRAFRNGVTVCRRAPLWCSWLYNGELGGYIGNKKLCRLTTRARQRGGLQAAYPGLTGQQATGGQTGPQMPQGVSDSIEESADRYASIGNTTVQRKTKQILAIIQTMSRAVEIIKRTFSLLE